MWNLVSFIKKIVMYIKLDSQNKCYDGASYIR